MVDTTQDREAKRASSEESMAGPNCRLINVLHKILDVSEKYRPFKQSTRSPETEYTLDLEARTTPFKGSLWDLTLTISIEHFYRL